MLLKDRTRRRLRWFVAAIVTVGCAGIAGYFLRDRHLENTARAGRDAGVRQLEEGDYFHALHNIGPYLRRHPNDAEALFAYARARQQVPEPNSRHLTDTLGLLRRVLTLSPNHMPASEALLALYQECGLMTETLQLSQDILAIDAKNRAAMKAKVVALNFGAKGSTGNPDAALSAALAYNELWPADVEGHLLTMEILNRGDTKRERAVAHFAKLREKSPNDPLATLLAGWAHLTSGDTAAAGKLINDASKMEMPDAAAVQALVRACDQLEMFDRSMDVLKRHAARAHDEASASLLAGRLWELESYQELAQRFVGEVGRDAQPAALRCMALNELGQKEQAQAALAALNKAAPSNPSARHWAVVLEALNPSGRPNDAALIRACQDALRGRDNAYLRFILGEAYLRVGDADAAIQSWLQVMAQAPAWASPVVRLSQVAAATGDTEQALIAAQRAMKRAPQSSRAMLTLATAQVATLKTNPAAASEVLALLDQVTKTAPKDAPHVLPLRIRVLAGTDRSAEAIAEARRALDPAAGSSASTLMQLASLSEELKLGIEQEIRDHCERAHGLTPQLALSKAKAHVDAGRKTEAVQLVERARASAASASSASSAAAAADTKSEWDAAWARVLEATNDPRAKDAWVALADSDPANAQLQWTCFNAPSLQNERALKRRLLDRLKEQFGDRGPRWRLAHAQWLFAGRQENSQNAVDAALVLNELTRDAPHMLAPKLLLAECQVHLGQASGAIEQLTSAATLRPESSDIALKLARLLQSRGDAARARTYLDAVAQNRTAPLAHQREAAEMLAAQGDSAAALATLERAYGAALKDAPADLLLARLYRATNQPQRAEAICKRLLESPDVIKVAFVADFYAAQRRPEDAAKVLGLLQTVATKPGEKEMVLGNHALNAGDAVKAAAHFTDATRAAPGNALAWRELIRLDLRDADNQKAIATARLAQAAVARDTGFAAFVRQAPQVVKHQARWPEIRSLWGELLDAPEVEKAFIELVELLPSDNITAMGTRQLNRLTAMASEHHRLLSLQFLAARASMQAGRVEDASRVASAAAQNHRDKAGSAQFAVNTLASAGRWAEVLEVARQWREATPNDTVPADQMMAAAYGALGNFTAARDQLKPHLTRALAEPEKFRFLLSEYATLEARLTSPEAAAALLRPRLADAAHWRIAWMRLAGANLPPAAAVAWMQEVEPQAVKGELEERLTLADCWHAVAQRSKDPAHAAHAQTLLARVADDPQSGTLSAAELVLIASLQSSQGSAAGAEATYRKALALNPQLTVAQNNLAMILAERPAALDEALALAQQAVSSAQPPQRAGVYDTLAFVQGRRGEYAAAVASIQQALTLKPNDPRYQVRLATMLIGDQQIDRAKTVLDQLKSRSGGTSPQIRKEIQSLQERIDRTSSARAS